MSAVENKIEDQLLEPPKDLTSDELKIFQLMMNRAKRYPNLEWCSEYSVKGNGSKGELIASGLIKPEWFPGVLGTTKTCQRIIFRTPESDGEVVLERSIRAKGLERMITIEGMGSNYRVWESFPKSIHKKLIAVRDKKWEKQRADHRVEEAKKRETIEIRSLPTSLENANWKFNQEAKLYLEMLERVINRNNGGYSINSKHKSLLLEKISDLASEVDAIEIDYSSESRAMIVANIKHQTALADPIFQSFINQFNRDGD